MEQRVPVAQAGRPWRGGAAVGAALPGLPWWHLQASRDPGGPMLRPGVPGLCRKKAVSLP